MASSRDSEGQMTPKSSPRRFRAPSTKAPDTPRSNFEISTPTVSSEEDEEEEDEEEVGNGLKRNQTSKDSSSDEEIDDLFPNNNEGARQGRSSGLRSILGASGGSNLSEILRRRRMDHEGRGTDDDGMSDTVLAVIWANGQLGAAYYSLETAEVMLLPDTAESAPDYWVMKSLLNQVMPRYVIVNSRQDERMITVLQELTGNKIDGEEDAHEDEEDRRATPSESHISQLFLLNGKDFSPDLCKQRILSLKIPYEPKGNSVEEHNLFISTLIPFRSEIMVRAAGALLKFLDKSAIEIFQLEVVDGQVPVLDIKICTMDEMVLVDDSAWHSLQIFSTDVHPSSVKQGNQSASKEGLSVFSCINLCSTVQGSRYLRLMLLRPCRNVSTLQRRYDVIDFCCSPSNAEFVKSATDCLKCIKSLPKLLYKLSLLHATVAEWKDLYQSAYHCLLLCEICVSQSRQFPEINLLTEICSDVHLDILKKISQEMLRVIDFEESKKAGRVVSRQGIDPDLDNRKQQYVCLPDIMSMVSTEEIQFLPAFINQCCVVYIPEVGYLLAITLWGPGLSKEELEIPDLEFKFRTSEMAYYKSARTKELDSVLGDCLVAIVEKETAIMIFLAEKIIAATPVLLKVGQLVSELDCLLAMSMFASRNGFIRPNIVPGDQPLKIIDGRHPLAELMCDFVPNSTVFSSKEKVSIITGPNASGKSIYLKQIGVIVILALSGSFVPASYAQIPCYDRICTRIHATESLSTGFSSFMIDLNQMSLALRTATKHSLVIVDEFGKGTADADGLSLLAATIEDFLGRKENCPTIFLSTHFYSVVNYLKKTPLIKMQSMKFIHKKEGDRSELTYLFVLTDGVCETSFASAVASHAGIAPALVERSKIVEKAVRYQIGEEELAPIKSPEVIERENLMVEIAEQFLATNIDEINPHALLANINSVLSQFM